MSSNNPTHLQRAQMGEMTPTLRQIAHDENRPVEWLREEFATGRLVIPHNRHRALARPIGIGRDLRAKINVNLGTSLVSGDKLTELGKLRCALNAGADAVMDLSTGPHADSIRKCILAESPAPVGTVPIYEAVADLDDASDLTPRKLLDHIEQQAAEGVDFMTLHAGLLLEHLPLIHSRWMGIVSRGGALLARWMAVHNQQNPLYTHFDDVLDICRKHDVTISLGDGLRPGCLADASDRAQFSELHVIADLVRRSRAAGVQVMVEGPGHIPLHQIEMNMRLADSLCDGAPLYVLGPIVTDCAPGYDHIVAAIGAAWAAWHGASFLCCVTPSEHVRLPTCEDIHEGTIAFRIAAHAADIARLRPNARARDDAISLARKNFAWDKQFALALDPERARSLHQTGAHAKGETQDNNYCSMCGPKYCAMRISRDLQSLSGGEGL